MNLFFVNVAYASESLDQFLHNVNKLIINPLIIFIFTLALILFLYGVVEFITNQQNEEKRTKGKSHMIWGVVGITIMMAVFTLMNLIISTLNIDGIDPEEGTVELPSAE